MANINDEERRRRQHDADRIRHSTAMEGGTTSEEVRELQDLYVRGEVTEVEYNERVVEHLAQLRDSKATGPTSDSDHTG